MSVTVMFFFSSRRRHTSGALVTGVQTCALPISGMSPPPPKLTPKQAGMIDKLRGASASAFDRTYLAQQTSAHDKALKLHQNYASNGDTPALKSVASKASTKIGRAHV